MPRSRHPEKYPVEFHKIAERVGEHMETFRMPAEGPMPDGPDPLTGEPLTGHKRLERIRAKWYAFVTALRASTDEWQPVLVNAKRVGAEIYTDSSGSWLLFQNVQHAPLAADLALGAFITESGTASPDPAADALASLEAQLAHDGAKK